MVKALLEGYRRFGYVRMVPRLIEEEDRERILSQRQYQSSFLQKDQFKSLPSIMGKLSPPLQTS